MGQPEQAHRDDEIVREQCPSPPAEEKRSEDDAPDVSSTGGLAGVEKIQATTKTWTKPWLIAAYAWYVKACGIDPAVWPIANDTPIQYMARLFHRFVIAADFCYLAALRHELVRTPRTPRRNGHRVHHSCGSHKAAPRANHRYHRSNPGPRHNVSMCCHLAHPNGSLREHSDLRGRPDFLLDGHERHSVRPRRVHR